MSKNSVIAVAVAAALCLLLWNLQIPQQSSSSRYQTLGELSDSSLVKQNLTEPETIADPTTQTPNVPNTSWVGCARPYGLGNRVVVTQKDENNETTYTVHGVEGQLQRGTLPFAPNHQYAVGREDGSTLIAFGDLRLNSKKARDPSAPEPAIVMLDDQVLYQADKVLDLGVTDNGSAFYVIEPQASGYTRLRLQNLNTGVQQDHDLGLALQDFEYSRSASIRPSVEHNELMMISNESRNSQATFFPVGGGGPIEREVNPDLGYGVLYESSETAFLIDQDEAGKPSIVKIGFDSNEPDSPPKEIWRRPMTDTGPLYETSVEFSTTGDWLVVHGDVTHVLNKSDGSTSFSTPVIGEGVRDITVDHQGVQITRFIADKEALQQCHFSADPLPCIEKLRQSNRFREFRDTYAYDGYRFSETPTDRTELTRSDGECEQLQLESLRYGTQS